MADRLDVVGRLLSVLVLPHELAHYAVFAPWGRSLHITREHGPAAVEGVAPPDRLSPPVARLAGGFDPAMPTAAVRLGAVAPTLLYPVLALLVDVGVGVRGGPAAVAGFVLLSLWAAPSAGDLAVFRHAERVRRDGSLDPGVPVDRRLGLAAVALAVAVTWATGLLFLT